MQARQLRLTLRSDDHLPTDTSWRIDDGYIRANTWNAEGESITLGIWGPGDLITPSGCALKHFELVSLTRVVVEECLPSEDEYLEFLRNQIIQTTHLLQIHRVRPADARLLRLLHWIGERFGRVSSNGTTLSLEDMNLTHRHLADISGLTRVTVTKALTRFRASGMVVKVSDADLLVPRRIPVPESVPSIFSKSLPPPPLPRTLRHGTPAPEAFRRPT